MGAGKQRRIGGVQDMPVARRDGADARGRPNTFGVASEASPLRRDKPRLQNRERRLQPDTDERRPGQACRFPNCPAVRRVDEGCVGDDACPAAAVSRAASANEANTAALTASV